MFTESILKSSITVDTAFRKGLSLQGCTVLSTRDDRLYKPHGALPLGHWQRCDRLRPLPYVDLFHEPRQKVLVHYRKTAVLRSGTVLLCTGRQVVQGL